MHKELYTIEKSHFKMTLPRNQNELSLRPKKNVCVSDRPTNPKILQPTLTFFMPKRK
jgi:hypothetical protein